MPLIGIYIQIAFFNLQTMKRIGGPQKVNEASLTTDTFLGSNTDCLNVHIGYSSPPIPKN
jgi:hypothetical protein